MFGWSMPAGCSGTPYDETAAEELKVPGLPADVFAFWVDGEVVVFQKFHSDGEIEPTTLLSFEHLGEDELSEEENSAATVALATAKWEEFQGRSMAATVVHATSNLGQT